MDAYSPTGDHSPSGSCPWRGCDAYDPMFFDIELEEWQAWLLHRIAEGDVVTIARDGCFLITNPPLDSRVRLST